MPDTNRPPPPFRTYPEGVPAPVATNGVAVLFLMHAMSDDPKNDLGLSIGEFTAVCPSVPLPGDVVVTAGPTRWVVVERLRNKTQFGVFTFGKPSGDGRQLVPMVTIRPEKH